MEPAEYQRLPKVAAASRRLLAYLCISGFQTCPAFGQSHGLETGFSPADTNVGETADTNVCATSSTRRFRETLFHFAG
jgi:hypothetical protein